MAHVCGVGRAAGAAAERAEDTCAARCCPPRRQHPRTQPRLGASTPPPPQKTPQKTHTRQSCAGLAYSYALYAPAIKDSLRLSQTQVATVGSAVNLGGYFAVGAGFIYDQLKDHHKLGPRWVLC